MEHLSKREQVEASCRFGSILADLQGGLKVVREPIMEWILSTSGNNLVMGCLNGCFLGGKRIRDSSH